MNSYMKIVLLSACAISLIATAGCVVADGDRHEHARYEHHDPVIVGPPVVEVHAPVVEVRPPEVIVR
jgi:hypothetical protein